jgi:predicted glutamine amidotransferase
MCRLLAFAGRQPVTVVEALGANDLADFRALSRQHRDGWGMAWWPPEARGDLAIPLTERSTLCAADDPRFAELATGVASDAGFVHLRWATHGLTVAPANTHPFVRGRLAFAHNGAINPQERWNAILPDGWEPQMRGTTDSERYFLAIVERLEAGLSVTEAVESVVHRLFTDLLPTSLNAMLLAPDALYVISAYDPDRVPTLNMLSRGRLASEAPDTGFYDLRQRKREHSIVVASSGFSQRGEDGWDRVENMTLLRIERETLATSVSSLTSPAHSRR